MSEWRGLHNPERHDEWTTTDTGRVWAKCAYAGCGPCTESFPCRCCLAAEVEALRAQVQVVRELYDLYSGLPAPYAPSLIRDLGEALDGGDA